MYKGTSEFPRTPEFMKYAASSCGMPAELHGKQETMKLGSEITLELPQPFTESAFCRSRVPPIVVKVARFCVMNESQVAADPNAAGVDRIFEGQVVKSLHQTIREGDTVIGLAGPGCDILVLNAENPEDIGHLLSTYDDEDCMQHVSL